MIFSSPNGTDYANMVLGGFSRFLAVFWVKNVKNQNFKIFKIGQKFDFPKMHPRGYHISNKRGKWFFEVQRLHFGHWNENSRPLRPFEKIHFCGQNRKFCNFQCFIIWTLNSSEMMKISKKVSKCVLQVPKILLNTLDDVIWWLEEKNFCIKKSDFG